MARPGRLELPTLCLEAAETILPNLARGSATGVLSASSGNSSQLTFSCFVRLFVASAAFFLASRYVFVTDAKQPEFKRLPATRHSNNSIPSSTYKRFQQTEESAFRSKLFSMA
jgi:hypothetical protein